MPLRYFIILMLLYPIGAIGQITFLLDTVVTNIPANQNPNNIVAKNWVQNNSNVEETLKWTSNVLSITNGWDVSICDLNACYGPNVESELFSLMPNDSSFLDVHIFTNGIFEGYAMVEVIVEETRSKKDTKSAIYILESNETSTSIKEYRTSDFVVYPNPSNGYFQFYGEMNLGNAKIFNASGQLMESVRISSNNILDLSSYQTGNYIVHFLNEEGVFLGAEWLSKI